VGLWEGAWLTEGMVRLIFMIVVAALLSSGSRNDLRTSDSTPGGAATTTSHRLRDGYDGEVATTREFLPGAYFDLDANGRLLGIEIVNTKNVLEIPASELRLSGETAGHFAPERE
jgi:uncharacterized protein YuzE